MAWRARAEPFEKGASNGRLPGIRYVAFFFYYFRRAPSLPSLKACVFSGRPRQKKLPPTVCRVLLSMKLELTDSLLPRRWPKTSGPAMSCGVRGVSSRESFRATKVLPVPGGPCRRTPRACRSLSAARRSAVKSRGVFFWYFCDFVLLCSRFAEYRRCTFKI